MYYTWQNTVNYLVDTNSGLERLVTWKDAPKIWEMEHWESEK